MSSIRPGLIVLAALVAFGHADHVCAQESSTAETAPVDSAKGIAVVELFTSQGCNSCPPADAALRQIANVAGKNGLPVFVLSFHVDYWNRLGWRDPYSDALYSNRQRGYARAIGSRRVYTPQMIVNGTTEFVGSDRAKAQAAIVSALKTQSKSVIRIECRSITDDSIGIDYSIEGTSENRRLNLAIVHTPKANEVPRGENAGRTLQHVNVVRAFRSIELDTASGRIELTPPSSLEHSRARLIAYVQDPKSLQITGATSISVGSPQ